MEPTKSGSVNWQYYEVQGKSGKRRQVWWDVGGEICTTITEVKAAMLDALLEQAKTEPAGE